MFKKILLLAGMLATPVFAKTVEIDNTRTVKIEGPITFELLPAAHDITNLTKSSQKPIYIVINSGGGSIYAGLPLIQAIRIAKTRGIEVRCVVPVMAASMAFQILANCSKRYVLPSSLLLWHPGKIFSLLPMSADELEYHAEHLRNLERPMQEDLIRLMKVRSSFFLYHYEHETLWTGQMLNRAVPGFITVVEDIKGLSPIFQYGDE